MKMGMSDYDRWKTREPEDYSWAYERAAEEFEKGYLDGEFDEAIMEEELLQELYGRMWEKHGSNNWKYLISFLETHFPRSFERAMERVVEERGEQIIEEGAHDDA